MVHSGVDLSRFPCYNLRWAEVYCGRVRALVSNFIFDVSEQSQWPVELLPESDVSNYLKCDYLAIKAAGRKFHHVGAFSDDLPDVLSSGPPLSPRSRHS